MERRLNTDNNSTTEVGPLVVSVQKARKILGTLANPVSDDQVKDLIYSLHLLAKEQLVYNGSKYDTKESVPNLA